MRSSIVLARAGAGEHAKEGIAPLEEILRTEELWRRPRRQPDYAAENRGLSKLVQELASSPESVLQTLADTLLEVLRVESAGVSLLTEDEMNFHWPAIAGGWTPHLGGGTPRDFGPCGDVLDRNTPLLFTHWERRYPYLKQAVPLAEEGLLVPFYVGGKAVGTIWVIAHDSRRTFDAEDLRQLQSFGMFASAAYYAIEIRSDIEARKQAAAQQQFLIDELNHRVKNTLATVQSIATHTLSSVSEHEACKKFEGRLVALSRTHDQLSRKTWQGVSLSELLNQELAPFRNGATFSLGGPELELRPKAALALGLAFHELATNAVKYGALSVHGGVVRVNWEVLERPEGRCLVLRWTELGGPPVEKPTRGGFGRTILERGLSLELKGKIAMYFQPEGVQCVIEIPLPD